MADDGDVPIVTGGLIEEWGDPKTALRAVQQQIRAFRPCESTDDYCVDIAVRTWHNFREPAMPPGVTPGAVGRTQRRFIVWHSIPQGLSTVEQVRMWFIGVLPETERLVREYLPTKSRAYPSAQLADEVSALRRLLAASQ